MIVEDPPDTLVADVDDDVIVFPRPERQIVGTVTAIVPVSTGVDVEALAKARAEIAGIRAAARARQLSFMLADLDRCERYLRDAVGEDAWEAAK